MTTLTFDAPKFANRLRAAGEPPAQAEVEALAEALADAFKASDQARRADVETLRRAIAQAKADIVKWLAGLLIAQAAVVAALVKLLR